TTPVGDLCVPRLSNIYADQVVRLNAPVDVLFQGLDSACQRAIRKAQRAGLTFEETHGDTVAEYYELAAISAQRTGETLLPKDYYQSIWHQLHKEGRSAVLFVRHQSQAAA